MTEGAGPLLLSCPPVVIGHPESFLFSPEDGFPIKDVGNDKRGRREGQGGSGGDPGAVASPSVMPAGCYRASSVFSLFPEDGFPIKDVGNDRGGGGKDKGGVAGIRGRWPLLLSCPTVVIGHPEAFLFSPEDGFPIKDVGNDKRGRREGQGGSGGNPGAVASPSVMPDGCYRASSVFSLFPEDGFPIKDVGNDRGGGAPSSVMPAGLLLSCPTVVIGHPASFLFSPEDGFPIKDVGNDKRGRREGQGGSGGDPGAVASPSVMPDGCYRASSIFSSSSAWRGVISS